MQEGAAKMELRNVKTFMKAAELMNFTKSGEELGYSQGTVTAQVKQLEDELGVRLFDRLKNGVALTSEGRRFIPYARALLNAADEAENFSRENVEPEGNLVIDATTSISDDLLPELLRQLIDLYPKLRFTVRVIDSTKKFNDDLTDGSADFALVTKAETEEIDHEVFAEFSAGSVYVCRADDPLAGRKNVPLEEVTKRSFFITNRNENYSLDLEKGLAARGLSIDPIADFSSTTAVINMVIGCGGVTFLPEYAVRSRVESGLLAIIDTEDTGINISVRFYRNGARWADPAMQAFMDYIDESGGSWMQTHEI